MEDHEGHQHHTFEMIPIHDQTCKGCGQQLTPVVLYLHPEQKATLEWLEKDRKKSANTIIEHLIQLEGSKRQIAASKRTRSKKA
jgi:hypothetical protein